MKVIIIIMSLIPLILSISALFLVGDYITGLKIEEEPTFSFEVGGLKVTMPIEVAEEIVSIINYDKVKTPDIPIYTTGRDVKIRIQSLINDRNGNESFSYSNSR